MSRAKALTRSALRAFPLPAQEDGGKDEHGRLLVVAGSRQVPGAAILAARAALRSGAGKVRVATVAGVAPPLALQMPELFVVPLAEARNGGCGRASVQQVAKQAQMMDAVVAGPGMRHGSAEAGIAKALLRSGKPVALDAGLLHCLAPVAAESRAAAIPPVLLPQSRELAALLDKTEEEIDSDRLRAANEAAERYGAFVLAKGTQSHIAAPDGRAWTYRGGAPGLGVAGSGDVLSGIVGALLARGAEPLTALLWGVLLHGEAGEALSREVGPIGFLASEIADAIPALLRR